MLLYRNNAAESVFNRTLTKSWQAILLWKSYQISKAHTQVLQASISHAPVHARGFGFLQQPLLSIGTHWKAQS